MTATLAPSRTPLEAATSAWRLANGRERSHAKRCRLLRIARRCVTCLNDIAAQDVAADRVNHLRLAAPSAARPATPTVAIEAARSTQ